jgi:hypothetical protein
VWDGIFFLFSSLSAINLMLTSALAKASMSNALAPNTGENATNDAVAKAAFLKTVLLESIALSESLSPVVIASWVMVDLLFELTGVIVNASEDDDRNKIRHTFRKEVMLNYTVGESIRSSIA